MKRAAIVGRAWLNLEFHAAKAPASFFSTTDDSSRSGQGSARSDERSKSHAEASSSGREGSVNQLFAQMKQSNMAGNARNPQGQSSGGGRPQRQPGSSPSRGGTPGTTGRPQFRAGGTPPHARGPPPPPRSPQDSGTPGTGGRGGWERPPPPGWGPPPRQGFNSPSSRQGSGQFSRGTNFQADRQGRQAGFSRPDAPPRPGQREGQPPPVLPGEDDDDPARRMGASRRERSQLSAKLRGSPARSDGSAPERGAQSARGAPARRGGRGGRGGGRDQESGPPVRQSWLGRQAQLTASPEAQMLLKEEGQYVLPEKEPFALMARDTKKRICSTAALTSPMTEEVEAIRAEVMRNDPVVNFQWGAPVRAFPAPSLNAIAEQYKAVWMKECDLETDEQWEEFKKESLAGADDEVLSHAQHFNVRDFKAEENVLHVLRDGVPSDHPMRSHVNMTVLELNRNPWWSFSDKYKYVASLVKNYV